MDAFAADSLGRDGRTGDGRSRPHHSRNASRIRRWDIALASASCDWPRPTPTSGWKRPASVRSNCRPVSYQSLRSILKRSLDRQLMLEPETGKSGPRHENVRGAHYYDPPTRCCSNQPHPKGIDMLNQPTIEKLHTMKLHGMADAFRAQLETTDASQLSFEERFAMLVDQQWLWKENRALARRLHSAKLKERGVIEDIDYQHPRGLDRKLLRTLCRQRMGAPESKLLFIGPTGIGKSWLACALAQKACRDGFSVLHKRTAEMFRDLAVAHVDGSIGRVLLKLARIDVLVLDDFAMAPLKDSERRDFLEICDDRYQRRSMILTSQMPIAHWHEQIGDPTHRRQHSRPAGPQCLSHRTQWRIDAQKTRRKPDDSEREKRFSPVLSGARDSNAVPLPHTPIPAQNRKILTDVNISGIMQVPASLRSDFIHIARNVHSHRRNPQSSLELPPELRLTP